MRTFIEKLAAFILSLILVSLTVFLVFQVIPGDPALIILGADADANQLETLRANLGLDAPLWERYLSWTSGALTGNFGTSLKYGMPVSTLIAERMPVTLALGFGAIIMSVIIGFSIGIIITKSGKSAVAEGISAFTGIWLAIPSFWLGLMLMLVFSVIFKFFPAGGYISYKDNPHEFFRGLFLPSLSLAIGNGALIARFLKNSVNENMGRDYVRTARSKGCDNDRILFVHVLKNACLPVITITGMIAAETLSGSIIVENVFSLPGLGQLLVTSISSRDLPLVQAACLYIAVIVVSVNFIVDWVYKLADPRM